MLYVVCVFHWHFIYMLILDSFPEGRYVFYKLPNFMQGYSVGLATKCMFYAIINIEHSVVHI